MISVNFKSMLKYLRFNKYYINLTCYIKPFLYNCTPHCTYSGNSIGVTPTSRAFRAFLFVKSGFRFFHAQNMAGTLQTINPATTEFLKYDEAIRKLNSLQSNSRVLQEASKNILSGTRHNNVKTTLKYLERIDLNIESINDRIIHVSGTKGKGSTAMLTESLLRSVPYKTGLFVSPHVTSVRDRISVNGAPLSLSTFVDYFWQVYNPLYERKENEIDMPSYFKFLTIMALKVFISENVDVAIIEVGVGGELDCTNVFKNTPIVGITSIGLDHTSILGNTEESIAWQKAGILKPGSRAFTIPDHKESVLHVFQSRALEKKCQLEVVPHVSDYSWNTSELSYPQKLNASLALQLAKAWDVWNNNHKHLEYDRLAISEREKIAITKCKIRGRCHVVHCKGTNVTYYLDGAHTLESIKVAKKWFEEISPKDSKRILIFNVTGNRSAKNLLEVLKDSQFSVAIFCTNNLYSRTEDLPADFIKTEELGDGSYLKAKENLQVWLSLGPSCGHATPNITEALSLIQESSSPTSVLITGSLHLVGSTLSLLEPS